MAARLEAAAGNALDRLKASQQALRKGVAVSRQLTAAHAQPPAGRTRRRVRLSLGLGQRMGGMGYWRRIRALRRDYCKPGAARRLC